MGLTERDDLALFVAADGTVDAPGDARAAAALAIEHRRRSPGARIAVHAGTPAQARRRAGLLREIANPGQIVVSAVVASLLSEGAPAGYELRDAGVHRLRDLGPAERVFELRPAEDGSEPPSLRSVDRSPNNLPVQLTSFVGRGAEAAAIRSLLARGRVVTIAGAGGCGKSRLAAEVAAADIDLWPDGVWWIDLQSVTDPSAVPARVADSVGVLVEPVSGPRWSLTHHLRDARTLLCLDNSEHVLDAVADLVNALVISCPEVSVLATSRQPVNVAAEAIYRVPSLRDAEAVELFAERARQVRPSFAVDDANRPVLQRLCRALDGIPLAIELAAAWVRSLSLQQIGAGLDDRFSLLVNRSRGSGSRHRTLEASIDWSHDRLDEAQRTVLRRLAVFAGGFDMDAAQGVCGADMRPAAVRSLLDGLVDKSLVVVEDADDRHRFRLLETIRQYASRRLDQAGERAVVQDRQLDHFLALAEGAEPLVEHDKDAWRSLVEPEADNLRAALDWGLSAEEPDRGRRLAAATAWLWNLHGRGREGLAVLRRAMDAAPADRSRLQARLMLGYALVGDTIAPGDLDPVRAGRDLAAELGDQRLKSRFLTLAAVGAFANDNDLETAWQRSDDAVISADAAGDEPGRDLALALRGLILYLRARHDAAQELLVPVAQRLIQRGERGVASTVLVFCSRTALDLGDLTTARQLAEQAAEVAAPLADYHRVGMAESQLTLLHGVTGDIDGGLTRLRQFLRIVEGVGTDVIVPGMTRTLGLLHLWRGDLDDGIRWLAPSSGGTDRTAHSTPDPLAMPPLATALRHQGRHAEAAAVLDRAEAIARRTDTPGVVADVLDQRAHLAADDDLDTAFDLHHEALRLRVDHGLRTSQIVSLEALAARMAPTRRAAHATRSLAAATRARASIGVPRHPLADAMHATTVTQLRDALGDDGYDAAWREGWRMTLDEAVVLIRRARGRRARPTTGWGSLTPTELQVVALVVDGLSNPDIAAKLLMRRSTVKSHLSHIFAKLEVSNRIELAAVAAPRLGDIR